MAGYDVIIIGAGPIGIACAVEARRRGLRHLVLEKGCLVNSIYHYPVNMRFFSTPDLLEIAGIPFVCQGEKPTRAEALEYYRRLVEFFTLEIHLYEEVLDIQGGDGAFRVVTRKGEYGAAKIILATGFFDRPRLMRVPGEELDKVSHYYREPHPYAHQDLLIVGSGNSSAIAALECHRHHARVTVAIRGEDFHEGVKYWILPDMKNRIKDKEITAYFQTQVVEIKPALVVLSNSIHGSFEIPNDFVLALTGYEPDYDFLHRIGIPERDDDSRTPAHNPVTYETRRPGIYLAGVVVGGRRTNQWFIENSRAHPAAIFDHLLAHSLPAEAMPHPKSR
ncbi:MAG: YpdA family putative bacillithiol disulfide reductase [bacterium]